MLKILINFKDDTLGTCWVFIAFDYYVFNKQVKIKTFYQSDLKLFEDQRFIKYKKSKYIVKNIQQIYPNYIKHNNFLTQMMQQHDSSNSAPDQYFQKMGLKKVSFDGEISDSGQDSHSSQSNCKGPNGSKVKRNNYSKQISNLLKQEDNENGIDDEKTKLIKKNCVSAKMSRQRKKIYIQLLQKKVQSLKQNIINTRQKLKVNRSRIMHYIQESNKEKRVYIQEKMKDSKRLIAMSEQFSSLTNIAKNLQYEKKKSQMGSVVMIPHQHAHNYLMSIPENLQPNQIPPQMEIPRQESQLLSEANDKEANLANNKKSKRTLKNKQQPEPDIIFKQLQEKKQLLQLGINSYLYKFGINGILKNDVVELLKQKWYQLVIDQSILEAGKSSQLQKVICDFRDCFWQIDESNKKLDYLLRQLRDKIKPEYVVKFILQKQFFKSFSSTQPKDGQQSAAQLPSMEKMDNSEEVKQEKQEDQYDPSINVRKTLKKTQKNNHSIHKINDISQSFPYESQSIEHHRQKKSHQIYEEGIKRQQNDLDFQLDL